MQTPHSSATAQGMAQGVLALGLFQAQSKSKTKRNRASHSAGKAGLMITEEKEIQIQLLFTHVVY